MDRSAVNVPPGSTQCPRRSTALGMAGRTGSEPRCLRAPARGRRRQRAVRGRLVRRQNVRNRGGVKRVGTGGARIGTWWW